MKQQIMNFISPQRAANDQIHKNETQIDTRKKKLRHNTKVLENKNDTILRYWRLKTNKDIRNI